MISLRKLIEGTSGLLVMAACTLVGMAVGFSLALTTEFWIKASDGMANFWGGVVGAGLGAALAVLGSVHVQQREWKARLAPATNPLRSGLDRITSVLSQMMDLASREIADNQKYPWTLEILRMQEVITQEFEMLPDYGGLPRSTYEVVHQPLQAFHAKILAVGAAFSPAYQHWTFEERADYIQKNLEEAHHWLSAGKDVVRNLDI